MEKQSTVNCVFCEKKLDEHSTTLENKNPFNIPAIMAATEAVKISMNNRKLKKIFNV